MSRGVDISSAGNGMSAYEKTLFYACIRCWPYHFFFRLWVINKFHTSLCKQKAMVIHLRLPWWNSYYWMWICVSHLRRKDSFIFFIEILILQQAPDESEICPINYAICYLCLIYWNFFIPFCDQSKAVFLFSTCPFGTLSVRNFFMLSFFSGWLTL